MNTILRNIFGFLIGLVVGGALNMALVMAGPRVFPPPEGVDMTKTESLVASAHLLQPQHFVFPFLAHAVGTLGGAFLAFVIAGSYRSYFAYTIGALFLIGGIAAATMIPAPTWFLVLDLGVAYLPMAWLGIQIGTRVTQRKNDTPKSETV